MDHWSFLLFIDRWLLRVFRLHRQKLRRLFDYYGSLANEEFLFLSFFPSSSRPWLEMKFSSFSPPLVVSSTMQSPVKIVALRRHDVGVRPDKGYEGGFRSSVSVGKPVDEKIPLRCLAWALLQGKDKFLCWATMHVAGHRKNNLWNNGGPSLSFESCITDTGIHINPWRTDTGWV